MIVGMKHLRMYGGGGSPEAALFHGGANYHDKVRGGMKRGYVVFAPQHLFSAAGFPKAATTTPITAKAASCSHRNRRLTTKRSACPIAASTWSLK